MGAKAGIPSRTSPTAVAGIRLRDKAAGASPLVVVYFAKAIGFVAKYGDFELPGELLSGHLFSEPEQRRQRSKCDMGGSPVLPPTPRAAGRLPGRWRMHPTFPSCPRLPTHPVHP